MKNHSEINADPHASMLLRNSLFLSRWTSTLKPMVVAENFIRYSINVQSMKNHFCFSHDQNKTMDIQVHM